MMTVLWVIVILGMVGWLVLTVYGLIAFARDGDTLDLFASIAALIWSAATALLLYLLATGQTIALTFGAHP